MPIRITCPSCSSTLSVRDEFAGRAVKCPKCAGVIPPQPAPSTVSEPEAVATLPPAPPADEPKKSAKTASKVVGAPSAEAKDDRADEDDDRPRKKRHEADEDDRDEEPPPKKRRDDEDDEPRAKKRRDEDDRDEDDRPRKRRRDEDEDDRGERGRRDDDEDDRPRRKRRDEEDYDDEDDRPSRRRRRDEDDEDDYDDRPRRRRDEDDRPAHRRYAQGGSNVGLIVAGGAILLCLIAVVAGYFVYEQREAENKAVLEAANAEKEAKEKALAEKASAGAIVASYEKVKVGDTRAQADAALGKGGRAATAEDLPKVFRASSDKRRLTDWTSKVKEGRAILWQSGDDAFVLVMFHPSPEAGGRVQAKALRTKTESFNAGDLDDAAFLRRFPSKAEPKKGEPLP